jgi:hypothetical protein
MPYSCKPITLAHKKSYCNYTVAFLGITAWYQPLADKALI